MHLENRKTKIFFGFILLGNILTIGPIFGNDVDSHGEIAMPAAPENPRNGKRSIEPKEKNPSVQAPGLFEANKNGNPGFPFAVSIGGGRFASCQATLISARGGICMAATASHCLTDVVQGTAQKACPLTGRNFDFKRGTATIEMANFGRVTANVFVNPKLKDESGATNDSAVFSWACPEGAGKVPVISISNTPLADREEVFYGKVMANKEGLYQGLVKRPEGTVYIGGFKVGDALDKVAQPSEVKIQQGDSGGGLYRKLADGSLELVGVLSSKDDDGTPSGNYATNRSLDFIKCVQGSLERPALAQK